MEPIPKEALRGDTKQALGGRTKEALPTYYEIGTTKGIHLKVTQIKVNQIRG
jgi:hypothetical protein